MTKKVYRPEEIVNLLRQIEVAVANGKTTEQAAREAGPRPSDEHPAIARLDLLNQDRGSFPVQHSGAVKCSSSPECWRAALAPVAPSLVRQFRRGVTLWTVGDFVGTLAAKRG